MNVAVAGECPIARQNVCKPRADVYSDIAARVDCDCVRFKFVIVKNPAVVFRENNSCAVRRRGVSLAVNYHGRILFNVVNGYSFAILVEFKFNRVIVFEPVDCESFIANFVSAVARDNSNVFGVVGKRVSLVFAYLDFALRNFNAANVAGFRSRARCVDEEIVSSM